MDLVAVFTIGRQFPDKAIDLIDAACATAKKMMQIDSQEKEEDTVKKAIVAPNHVAQVSILFLMTFVYHFDQWDVFFMQILTSSFDGCAPMHRNSCLYAWSRGEG